MKWIFVLVLAFSVSVVDKNAAYAGPSFGAGPDTPTYISQCIIKTVTGDFYSPITKYTLGGVCGVYQDVNPAGQSTFDNQKLVGNVTWNAVATYDPKGKDTRETIYVTETLVDPAGFQATGTIDAWMVCATDPWRQPDGLPCGSVRYQKSGTIDPNLDQIYAKNRGLPRTSFLSADQRASLNKQYAEYIARIQRKEQELLQTPAQPNLLGQAFFPFVLSPAKGQNFIAQNPIAIRLAPPQGWKVAGYLVNVLINGYSCNLPVGAAQAQSSTGYTDFGAGKPPCFLATPGSYRLRAQTSSPTQSGWSDWVDFTVSPSRVTTPAGVGSILKK